MPKRQRTGYYTYKTRRPIDKSITYAENQVSAGVDTTTRLFTASSACTATGFRWSIAVAPPANTATFLTWALVYAGQNYGPSSLNLTNGETIYEPEQNVIAFGVAHLGDDDSGGQIYPIQGATNTARKMYKGDKIELIYRLEQGGTVRALVQNFCRE